MKLEDYEALPDSMQSCDVHAHTLTVLKSSEPTEFALAKLEVLADRQWHTYESPSPDLQSTLRDWLVQNWTSDDQEYLERVLGLAYCFALDKEIYKKALAMYKGENIAEFRQHLEKSSGDSIDPWWSMGERNA